MWQLAGLPWPYPLAAGPLEWVWWLLVPVGVVLMLWGARGKR